MSLVIDVFNMFMNLRHDFGISLGYSNLFKCNELYNCYKHYVLHFQDGIGTAVRIREQSNDLSILSMYDAQVNHIVL